MASMNMTESDPTQKLVEQKIETGQYASVSDHELKLTRRNQMQSGARQALVNALIDGEKSGLSNRRIPEILAAVKAELAQTAEC